METLLFSVLSIFIGLAFCFAGWTYFRVLFPIWGFLVGLTMGAQLMNSASGANGFLVTAAGLVVGLFLGVVFALMSNFVYKLAVVIFGGTIGYVLGAGIWSLFGLDAPFLAFVTGMIVSFVMIGFFISAKMPKWIMIVITGLAGSMAVVAGVLALFGQIPPSQLGLALVNPYVQNSVFWFIVWMVIAGLGMIAQQQMAQQEELTEALVWDDMAKQMEAASKVPAKK